MFSFKKWLLISSLLVLSSLSQAISFAGIKTTIDRYAAKSPMIVWLPVRLMQLRGEWRVFNYRSDARELIDAIADGNRDAIADGLKKVAITSLKLGSIHAVATGTIALAGLACS